MFILNDQPSINWKTTFEFKLFVCQFVPMRINQSPSYEYIESLMENESENKKKSREFSMELGLSTISLSVVEGALLSLLTSLIRPKKALEIGTLTGLSSQYILDALEKGCHLTTIEKSEQHYSCAKQALKPWIDQGQCQILLGDAMQILPTLSGKINENNEKFDLIFIDGNKSAYLDYWNWARQNLNSSGLIVIDNVFLAGAVFNKDLTTFTKQKFSLKQVETVQKMNHEIIQDKTFKSAFIPTDEGLLVSFKLA